MTTKSEVKSHVESLRNIITGLMKDLAAAKSKVENLEIDVVQNHQRNFLYDFATAKRHLSYAGTAVLNMDKTLKNLLDRIEELKVLSEYESTEVD